jgi:hypothetical protein
MLKHMKELLFKIHIKLIDKKFWKRIKEQKKGR